MAMTRVYVSGEGLQPDEALAVCGTCGRTIVVTLSPDFMQEFDYCSDRDECKRYQLNVSPPDPRGWPTLTWWFEE